MCVKETFHIRIYVNINVYGCQEKSKLIHADNFNNVTQADPGTVLWKRERERDGFIY
jgi:hypothetical protein